MNSEEDCKTKIINSPGLQYINYSIQRYISGPDKELRMYMHAQLFQPCPTLCDTMDCSPPFSSVQGILQARILVWIAMSSSRWSSQPRDWTRISCSSCIASGFTTEPQGKSKIRILVYNNRTIFSPLGKGDETRHGMNRKTWHH